MPNLPNSNYTPITLPPGVARGATSRSTPDRWYDTSLVRWRDGVLVPWGGWEPYFGYDNPPTVLNGNSGNSTTTAGTVSGPRCPTTPRCMIGWEAQNGARRIVIGCDGGFTSVWEGEFADITPVNFQADETTLDTGGYGIGAYGDEDYGTPRSSGEPIDFYLATTNYISLANFGERLLACTERDGRLLLFDPAKGTDSKFIEVVAPDGKAPVPKGNRGVAVSDERFVMLIGADGHDRRVAWSAREDYFDWDFLHFGGTLTGGHYENNVLVDATAVGGTAGYLDLQASSPLIAIKNVRNAMLVFSQTEVFQLQFVGDPYVYGQHMIESNSSLLSAYAIACFDGKAMWPTRTGFKLFDSGYIKPVPCDVEDFFIADLDAQWAWRTHAVVNNVYSEITWFYISKNPTAGAGVPNRYVTYNYEEGWWSIGELSRTAGIPVRINADPIMTDADGVLWRHEVGDVYTSAGRGTIFARSGAIEPGPGGALVTVIGVLPDSESGYDSTLWKFTTRLGAPEQSEVVHGPYYTRTDGYMDTRFTARQVEIEVVQNKPGRWTLGKPDFDIRPRGRR